MLSLLVAREARTHHTRAEMSAPDAEVRSDRRALFAAIESSQTDVVLYE